MATQSWSSERAELVARGESAWRVSTAELVARLQSSSDDANTDSEVSPHSSTSAARGLSGRLAQHRRRLLGPNVVQPPQQQQQQHQASQAHQSTAAGVLRACLRPSLPSAAAHVLLLAIIVLFATRKDPPDALITAAVVLVVLVREFLTLFYAYRAHHNLSLLAPPMATVRRDAFLMRIPVVDVVVGDILILNSGDTIAADARLLTSQSLQVDESILTADRIPVTKDANANLALCARIRSTRHTRLSGGLSSDQTQMHGSHHHHAHHQLSEHSEFSEEEENPRTKKVGPVERLLRKYVMVSAGTSVVNGRGEAIVTATGEHTQFAASLKSTSPPHAAGIEPSTPTPIHQSMRHHAIVLATIGLVLAIVVPLILVARGQEHDPEDVVLASLSFAFVILPKELPVLVVVVLVIGSLHLSIKKFLVKHMLTAELLGDITTIVTNKTGVLTKKEPRIADLFGALQHQSTCADVVLSSWLLSLETPPSNLAARGTAHLAVEESRDPFDLTLRALGPSSRWGQNLHLQATCLALLNPKMSLEIPFDPLRKCLFRRVTLSYPTHENFVVACRGAPESVLDMCGSFLTGTLPDMLDAAESGVSHMAAMDTAMRENLLSKVELECSKGRCVIAFAILLEDVLEGAPSLIDPSLRQTRISSLIDAWSTEQRFVFAGFASFDDPVRANVKAALNQCASAHIRVIVVTGEALATTSSLAADLGLLEESDGIQPQRSCRLGKDLRDATVGDLDLVYRTAVFARSQPEHKESLVKLLQQLGERVAVTGDAIKDVPVLTQADIGFAMGLNSADAAIAAAGVVLPNSDFAMLVDSIREGRKLMSNLRKAIAVYLALKLALVLLYLFSAIVYGVAPLEPTQIIVVQIFMDLGVVLTFVNEPVEDRVMNRPPRVNPVHLFDRDLIVLIIASAISLFAISVCAVPIGKNLQIQSVSSCGFVALVIGSLLLSANMRTERTPLFAHGFLSNRVWILWAFTMVVVTLIIIYSGLFKPVSALFWLVIFLLSIPLTFWQDFVKWVSVQQEQGRSLSLPRPHLPPILQSRAKPRVRTTSRDDDEGILLDDVDENED